METARAALGILLVHGIGSQRRGDTLVHCGGAIHHWLHEWLTKGPFDKLRGADWAIEVSDTALSGGDPAKGPAHSRLAFRRANAAAPHFWLVAESCWAETFRPPAFRDFLRWALHVIPFAVILHLLPSFQRAWKRFKLIDQGLRRGALALNDVVLVTQELGPERAAAWMNATPRTRGSMATKIAFKMLGRALLTGLLLAPLAFLGLVTQLLLVAVILLAIVPLLRPFAGWVQRTLTAVIGDSYVFLMSPLIASAAVTQVQNDLAWLSKRCMRVSIIAHSQGAAVAYRALRELATHRRRPPEVELFITYGSGVRKLFDLRRAGRAPALWTYLGLVALAPTLGLTALVVLAALGHVHIAVAALGAVVTPLLLAGVLVASSDLAGDAPELLDRPVEWDDVYASHDPIPNGPVTVRSSDHLREDSLGDVRLKEFQARQREVVNRRSIFLDHTTYWTAHDDFVGRVVSRLADVAKLPIKLPLDQDWLDMSAARRRWRVQLLSGCRMITCVAIVMTILCSLRGAEIVAQVGTVALPILRGVKGWLPPLPEQLRALAASPHFLGALILIAATLTMWAVAVWGWRMWETLDFQQFFYRTPYKTKGLGLAVFAVGWLGVTITTPIVALLSGVGTQTLVQESWSAALLLAASVGRLVTLGKRAGTRLAFWRMAQERGRALLTEAPDVCSETFVRARQCLSISENVLEHEPPSKALLRALLEQAKAWEGMSLFDLGWHRAERIRGAIACYEKALKVVAFLNGDPAELRRRLQAAQAMLSQ